MALGVLLYVLLAKHKDVIQSFDQLPEPEQDLVSLQ